MRRMYRHRLIVGGGPTVFELTADPVRVEARRLGVGERAQHVVDFWAEHDDEAPASKRTFQIFGTGHPLPEDARHRGSTARTDDGFVWHLYELGAAK